MKHLILTFLLAITVTILKAQQESAYYLLHENTETIEANIDKTKQKLMDAGFNVIGTYSPGNSGDLAVVCYTSEKLEKLALDFEDRGSLAASLKIGFRKDGNTVSVSMLNPMYLFYAYFIDNIAKHEDELRAISDKAIKTLADPASEAVAFGGTLEKKKLQNYHYKVMMPYFKNAEKLNQFSSFEAGLKVIQSNLSSGKGQTEQVYELVYAENEVAVWGVGLKNEDTGEPNFLPIIGDKHVAAMPYEIILQGNTASILPGKYRIALHWPELTMGTFMKIMSTPGDIKKTLKEITKM